MSDDCLLEQLPRDYFAGGGLLAETREEKPILTDILNEMRACISNISAGETGSTLIDKILTSRSNGQVLVSRATGNVLISR